MISDGGGVKGLAFEGGGGRFGFQQGNISFATILKSTIGWLVCMLLLKQIGHAKVTTYYASGEKRETIDIKIF